MSMAAKIQKCKNLAEQSVLGCNLKTCFEAVKTYHVQEFVRCKQLPDSLWVLHRWSTLCFSLEILNIKLLYWKRKPQLSNECYSLKTRRKSEYVLALKPEMCFSWYCCHSIRPRWLQDLLALQSTTLWFCFRSCVPLQNRAQLLD